MSTIERINNHLWEQFVQQESLSHEQTSQFLKYLCLLLSWNKKMNLTAITDPNEVITDHFQDSLAAKQVFDSARNCRFADVGAGAGIPGIPLLIKYPQLTALFIEVNGKKREFLAMVLEELGFSHRASLCALDWRTFLRQKEKESIDIFVARASLRPDELVRALTSATGYRDAKIVYWASQYWINGPKEERFLKNEYLYQCADKKRRLLVFAAS